MLRYYNPLVYVQIFCHFCHLTNGFSMVSFVVEQFDATKTWVSVAEEGVA
jgi:hypothetical protein